MKRGNSLLKSSFIFAIMTFLSRILGFIRDMVTASLLGSASDIFVYAQRIPNLFRRLFAEGSFSQAFTPILAKYHQENDNQQMRALIASASGWLMLITLGITFIGVLGSGYITMAIANGWWQEYLVGTSTKFAKASFLLKITFPYLFFVSMVALCGAIFNVYNRIALFSITPAILNISLILCALFLPQYLGGDINLALAIGVFVGGVVQLAVQIPLLYKLGVLVRPSLKVTPGVSKMFRNMVPALIGASGAQINMLINTIVASLFVGGTLSWLYYAERLLELPLGVFGVAISTIMLPTLSRKVHIYRNQDTPENRAAFYRAMDWGISTICVVAFPAMVALILLGRYVIDLLFVHGNFNYYDLSQTNLALICYSFSVLPSMMVKTLSNGFFAHENTKTPMYVSLFTIVVNALLNIIALWFNFWMLALATSISSMLNALILYILLVRKGYYKFSKTTWLMFGRCFLAAIGLAITFLYLPQSFTLWLQHGIWYKIFTLLFYGVVGLIVYFAILFATGFRPRNLRYVEVPGATNSLAKAPETVMQQAESNSKANSNNQLSNDTQVESSDIKEASTKDKFIAGVAAVATAIASVTARKSEKNTSTKNKKAKRKEAKPQATTLPQSSATTVNEETSNNLETLEQVSVQEKSETILSTTETNSEPQLTTTEVEVKPENIANDATSLTEEASPVTEPETAAHFDSTVIESDNPDSEEKTSAAETSVSTVDAELTTPLESENLPSELENSAAVNHSQVKSIDPETKTEDIALNQIEDETAKSESTDDSYTSNHAKEISTESTAVVAKPKTILPPTVDFKQVTKNFALLENSTSATAESSSSANSEELTAAENSAPTLDLVDSEANIKEIDRQHQAQFLGLADNLANKAPNLDLLLKLANNSDLAEDEVISSIKVQLQGSNSVNDKVAEQSKPATEKTENETSVVESEKPVIEDREQLESSPQEEVKVDSSSDAEDLDNSNPALPSSAAQESLAVESKSDSENDHKISTPISVENIDLSNAKVRPLTTQPSAITLQLPVFNPDEDLSPLGESLRSAKYRILTSTDSNTTEDEVYALASEYLVENNIEIPKISVDIESEEDLSSEDFSEFTLEQIEVTEETTPSFATNEIRQVAGLKNIPPEVLSAPEEVFTTIQENHKDADKRTEAAAKVSLPSYAQRITEEIQVQPRPPIVSYFNIVNKRTQKTVGKVKVTGAVHNSNAGTLPEVTEVNVNQQTLVSPKLVYPQAELPEPKPELVAEQELFNELDEIDFDFSGLENISEDLTNLDSKEPHLNLYREEELEQDLVKLQTRPRASRMANVSFKERLLQHMQRFSQYPLTVDVEKIILDELWNLNLNERNSNLEADNGNNYPEVSVTINPVDLSGTKDKVTVHTNSSNLTASYNKVNTRL